MFKQIALVATLSLSALLTGCDGALLLSDLNDYENTTTITQTRNNSHLHRAPVIAHRSSVIRQTRSGQITQRQPVVAVTKHDEVMIVPKNSISQHRGAKLAHKRHRHIRQSRRSNDNQADEITQTRG